MVEFHVSKPILEPPEVDPKGLESYLELECPRQPLRFEDYI